jgi:hypothetical protein
MLIRHAEKPDHKISGVLTEGAHDEHSLSVQGWQRAGALAVWLDPTHDRVRHPHLESPKHLYAAKFHEGHHSKRCYQTLMPLAEKLKLEINIDFKNEDFVEMVAHARSRSGAVLISWHHEKIPEVAREILGKEHDFPHWPDERFDVVWVFDPDAKGTYHLTQVPAMLLAGDRASPIK